MPGVITVRTPDSLLSNSVIDEALGLALVMTDRYAYVPIGARDSILSSADGSKWSPPVAAKYIGATSVVYITVSRLVNLVRVELIMTSGPELRIRTMGVGYASMKHAYAFSKAPVLQPALLLATQRALIEITGIRDLYAKLQPDLRARAAELYSIGGIEFKQDSAISPMWQLFDENTVVSYDLAQSIVHELYDVDTIAMIDIETRDSMYAMGRLFLVENDKAISRVEMRILRGFDIGHVITGTFERIPEGGRLTLSASTVDKDYSYSVLRSASRIVKTDSKEAMREAAKACAKELFKK